MTDWTSDWDFDDPYLIWQDLRGRCPMAHTDRYNEGTWLPSTTPSTFRSGPSPPSSASTPPMGTGSVVGSSTSSRSVGPTLRPGPGPQPRSGAALSHLAGHADDRARLVAEPDLIPTATQEYLRAYAPVNVVRRVTIGTVVNRVEMNLAIEAWLRLVLDFHLDPDRPATWAEGQIRGPRTVPIVVGSPGQRAG